MPDSGPQRRPAFGAWAGGRLAQFGRPPRPLSLAARAVCEHASRPILRSSAPESSLVQRQRADGCRQDLQGQPSSATPASRAFTDAMVGDEELPARHALAMSRLRHRRSPTNPPSAATNSTEKSSRAQDFGVVQARVTVDQYVPETDQLPLPRHPGCKRRVNLEQLTRGFADVLQLPFHC